MPYPISMAMSDTQLRNALKQLNLTQVKAAKRLGIDPRTMRRYCLGEYKVYGPVEVAVKGWLKEQRAAQVLKE